jgi:hypothetical protein
MQKSAKECSRISNKRTYHLALFELRAQWYAST